VPAFCHRQLPTLIATVFSADRQVTPCSSTAEALARLNHGSSFDVLLADKGMLTGKACSADSQQLLDSCSGVPCILMAQDPTQEDIMTGDARAAVVDSHVLLLWLLVVGLQQGISAKALDMQQLCEVSSYALKMHGDVPS
jgi:CheY-like chemotaxis protein